MLCKPFCHWCCNAAFMAAIVTCPLACAAAPSADTAGDNTISALLNTASPLSTRELGAVRGGFDLTPQLTINFAFQQIESDGSRIIQSIEVPMTTLTLNTPNITPIVTTGTDAVIPNVIGSSGTNSPAPATNTDTIIPNAPTTTTTSNYVPQTNNYDPSNPSYVPPSPSKITLSSTANAGATIVQSQLGGGGITNVISNTANNAMISQMTTMNIAISGMASWLSGQRSSFVSGGGAFGSMGLYR
jgi:hypothetical protein